MGMAFYNLTPDELCDLMCGLPEDDGFEDTETESEAKHEQR